jgi:hypothetical protein
VAWASATEFEREVQVLVKRLRNEPLTPEETAWKADRDRAKAQAEHDRLMREYDWTQNMRWWRRLLLRLFGGRGNWSYTSGEDDTCEVMCACGHPVWVAGEAWISWCPKCDRGYTAAIAIRQYPSWLRMGRPDRGNPPA